MKFLLDTHILLWLLTDDKRLPTNQKILLTKKVIKFILVRCIIFMTRDKRIAEYKTKNIYKF